MPTSQNSTTITITLELYKLLIQYRHPGQSLGGVIEELINQNEKLKTELNNLNKDK